MNWYSRHPDRDVDKKVFLHAAGKEFQENSRHVLIYWFNGFDVSVTPNGTRVSLPVLQIVQLHQNSSGLYYNPTPSAERQTMAFHRNNELFELGTFTRAQRDRLLRLARGLKFVQKSTKNGCRVWIRDLLEKMLAEEMISKEVFDNVDQKVPLVKRVPE